MQQQARNPVLGRLDTLVGKWTFEASLEGRTVARGRTSFEWIEGGAFLVQHAQAEPPLPETPSEWVANSPFPLTTLFGLDDSTEKFSMFHADSRGVFRVYEMTLDDGVWKIWRDAPGFFQRFTGTVDGDTITGYWEGSPDGSNWQYDFDQTYTKVG